MKTVLALSLLAGAFAMTAAAESASYGSTSGEITLLVAAWTSAVPAPLEGQIHQAPPVVTGSWITACTSNPNTTKLKAVIVYKSGMEVLTIAEDLGPLNVAGNGLHCGNTMKLISKDAIVTVSIVTASADFSDIH